MSEATRTDKVLCPLQSIGRAETVPCAGKRCAWWDRLAGFCSVFAAADSIRDAAEQVSALTFTLEGMEKEYPVSVCGTDGARVEAHKTGVSTPTITENGEFVNMNGLPDTIKVTISREDGSPVFLRDAAPQVLRLDEAAPVLLIVRNGGTLRTAQGDLHDLHEMRDFIEDLTLPY